MSLNTKQKQKMVGATIATVVTLALALSASLSIANHNMNARKAYIVGNWQGLGVTMVFVGLGVCFFLAQLLLVRRTRRR